MTARSNSPYTGIIAESGRQKAYDALRKKNQGSPHFARVLAALALAKEKGLRVEQMPGSMGWNIYLPGGKTNAFIANDKRIRITGVDKLCKFVNDWKPEV